jgi:hypothetical protein
LYTDHTTEKYFKIVVRYITLTYAITRRYANTQCTCPFKEKYKFVCPFTLVDIESREIRTTRRNESDCFNQNKFGTRMSFMREKLFSSFIS